MRVGLLLQLLVWGALILITLGKPRKNRGNKLDVIDKHIETLKKLLRPNATESLLEEHVADSLFNADIWRKLGALYQTKDVRQHIGGGQLQNLALAAFDNALALDHGRSPSLNVHVLYLRGILLKMMVRLL